MMTSRKLRIPLWNKLITEKLSLIIQGVPQFSSSNPITNADFATNEKFDVVSNVHNFLDQNRLTVGYININVLKTKVNVLEVVIKEVAILLTLETKLDNISPSSQCIFKNRGWIILLSGK